MKRCTRCDTAKPTAAFRELSRGGTHSWCKACENKATGQRMRRRNRGRRVQLPDTATVDRYRLSMLTEDDCTDWWVWDIYVENRGNDRWAITRGARIVLSTDGEWELEPSPSNREDDWLDTHRFDLAIALRLADEALPHLKINGLTPLDIRARRKQGDA